MADPYAFDLKIDVAKTRQWSERVNRQRQSGPDESDNDSDGLDDFLDDDDDDNDGDDHFDVSDSASFSDSESGKFRRQPQPTTADSPVFPGSRDSLNSSVGFGAAVELRMDPEQKAALSGSVQGMIQTRHDLDTIRWSQDSAVRAAMEEAEKFEQDTPAASGAAAVPFANTRSSKPSLGVRASMRSAGALKEGDDEDIDDDDASDVSSYNGSLSVSAPPSFRSSAKPIAQPQQPQASARVPAPAPQGAASTAASTTAKATTATARTVVPSVPAKPLNSTGLASPYSDVYTSDPDVGENDDDEYGDDSREESAADPTAAWLVSTTPAKPAGGDGNDDDDDGYDDDDAYEEGYEDDESPRPSPTHASRSGQNPPPNNFPTTAGSAGGAGAGAGSGAGSAGGVGAAEVKRLVAKLTRLGKAEFDSWDDEEGDGVCSEEEVAQHLNEYWGTFGTPLRVEACVALRNKSGSNEISGSGIAGEALGRALFAAVGNRHGFVNASGTSISDGNDGALIRLVDLEQFLIDANADLDNEHTSSSPSSAQPLSPTTRTSAPTSPELSSVQAAASAIAPPSPQPPVSPPPVQPPAPSSFRPESPAAPHKLKDAPAAGGTHKETTENAGRAPPPPTREASTSRPLSPPPPPPSNTAIFSTTVGASGNQSTLTPPSAAAAASTMAVHEEVTSNRSVHSVFAPQAAQTWQQQQQQASQFAATHATTTASQPNWNLHTPAEFPSSTHLPNYSTSARPPQQPPSIPAELKPYLSSTSGETVPEAEALPLVELSLEEVENLLWGLGFGDCSNALVETHGIDGSLLCLVETSDDLKELGVGLAVKRKKLFNLLSALQHPHTAPHGVPKVLLRDGLAKKQAAANAGAKTAAKEKSLSSQSGTATGSPSGGGIGYRPGERFHDRSRLETRVEGEDESRKEKEETARASQATAAAAEEARAAAEVQAQATAEAMQQAGVAAEAESEAAFTRQSNEAAANALRATQQHGAAHPLWALGASSASFFNDHGSRAASVAAAPDPTLPMARVYLRLLAEAQAEATAAKRQVAELTCELNALRSQRGGAATPTPSNSSTGGAQSPAAASNETAANKAAAAASEKTGTTAAGLNSSDKENDASAGSSHSTGTGSNLGLDNPFMSSGGGASRLTMQHATRQALLRRQYDLLREQLSSAQQAADFHGRNAHITNSTNSLTTTSNLQETLWRHLQQKPLTMEEALRRVDAGLG